MSHHTHPNQSSHPWGSPEMAALFLNNGRTARRVAAGIQTALNLNPGTFTPELITTAEAVRDDLRMMDVTIPDIKKPDTTDPLVRRLLDGRQVLGYLGIACGFKIPYINLERRPRPTLSEDQLDAAKAASLAVFSESAIATEKARRRSLHIARRFGGSVAVGILTRADPSKERGF